MKIGHPAENPTPPLPVLNGAAANTESAMAAAAPANAIPATAEASARIQLSNTATSLMSSSSSGAIFDADKVARISNAIDSGTFKINPEAIADKLISNAREVLTKIPD